MVSITCSRRHTIRSPKGSPSRGHRTRWCFIWRGILNLVPPPSPSSLSFLSLCFFLDRLYIIKSYFVGASMLGILIWWMVKARGASFNAWTTPKVLTGSAKAWLVLQTFNAGLGTASSLTVNQGTPRRLFPTETILTRSRRAQVTWLAMRLALMTSFGPP
jgi:hypothetical protein